MDFCQLDDFLVRALRLREVEFENLARFDRLGKSLDLLHLLDPTLDLGGFGGDRAEAIDELLQAFELLLLVPVSLDFLGVALLTLINV